MSTCAMLITYSADPVAGGGAADGLSGAGSVAGAAAGAGALDVGAGADGAACAIGGVASAAAVGAVAADGVAGADAWMGAVVATLPIFCAPCTGGTTPLPLIDPPARYAAGPVGTCPATVPLPNIPTGAPLPACACP